MISLTTTDKSRLCERICQIVNKVTLCVLASVLCGYCCAQPYALDLTFNPGAGTTVGINSVFVQLNGQIIISGGFTTFNNVMANGVDRLNSDGSVDTNFYLGQGPMNGFGDPGVYYACSETNGMVLVAGDFGTVNGLSRANLARLRVDGSLDTSFTPSVNGEVSQIIQQPNGQIIIMGGFSSVNGTSLIQIARLNTNGTLDGSFSPALTSSGATVIALDASGNVLVGGSFGVGGSNCVLARLTSNGSLDDSFQPAPINGPVNGIGFESNGEIIITGSFTSINGYSTVGIAELDASGALDTGFRPNPAVSPGFFKLLAIEGDGKIYTLEENGITRINTDGSTDATFNPVILPYDSEQAVQCMAIQPDGRLLLAGGLDNVNGTNIYGIARLQGDSLTPFQTQLLNINLYAGMQIAGSIGTNYRVEYATTLTQPSPWTPVATFTLTTTPFWFLDTNPVVPGGMRFYRAVALAGSP